MTQAEIKPKSSPPQPIEWEKLPPDERESVLRQVRIKASEARSFANQIENADTGWHRQARAWEALLKKVES